MVSCITTVTGNHISSYCIYDRRSSRIELFLKVRQNANMLFLGVGRNASISGIPKCKQDTENVV